MSSSSNETPDTIHNMFAGVSNSPVEYILEATKDDAAKLKRITITTPESPTDDGEFPEHTPLQKNLLLCRRFKDPTGLFRNFNSLPLFVYATSPSTHAISADGVGVSREAAVAIGVGVEKNDIDDLARCSTNKTAKCINDGVSCVIINAMECLPLSGNNTGCTTGLIGTTHAHTLILPSNAAVASGSVANGNHAAYQHHLNMSHHLNHHQHHHLLMSHQSATTPYSNNYPLQHSSSHHHIHSDQTKSLQELQHEVGALLEFRDLVIETFPDLKNKMASMSSSTSATSSGAVGAVGGVGTGCVGGGGSGSSVSGQSVSGTNTLTGGVSSSSLASRREWEPGIRTKRKTSQKELSTSVSNAVSSSNNVTITTNAAAGPGAGDLSSSSLTRSRSNSHSGKKEPKSGGENNGSVVQDSGFSTETSSSKEGHSASSTNGAMTGPNATNRLSCLESDDELLNLLDVIHRKSNRLREEVEHLQNYERTQLQNGRDMEDGTDHHTTSTVSTVATTIAKSASNNGISGLTPKTFREHIERLNKEDIKQLRKERDRLLDKLAEMEAETLTGRIKAAKMSDQVEELISVKKDLEEQLKLAMAQKLELSSRVQQLQQQQQQQSKSSSSQSDYSSQRNFSSSATTVLSTVDSGALLQQQQRRQNTFQPVVVIPSQYDETSSNVHNAFHQSAAGSDINNKLDQQYTTQPLGRLDGIVSSPVTQRNAKVRLPDSKRFAAILLETSVIELQRHLLRLTVQNQALMQKLDQSTKSKSNLAKRLDKSKEDVEDLRFQLEEKNIELEGTKAQLRVLESRIHTSTPNSTATINSTPSYLLHSQNDYETNRSSASTTLMLSRRGIGNDSTHSSDLRSSTPSAITMPPPTSTQISTPSMKAMTHLPMDEMQQHNSSTESAHDHDLPSGEERVSRLIMSTSVGGVSGGSFEKRELTTRRYLTSSKPSKIPLPGSKSVSYFGGKPPTGRPSTANSNTSTNSGRSPNSSTANMSSASSRSSLSRSTGNLLYSKSPNSLKRADSAQSIRNAVNTSNSSNIASGNVTTPSTSRVLQNSPLPKPKRDSITSRLRNIESISRSTQQQQHDSHTNTPTTIPRAGAKTPSSNSNLVSSTPKTGTIASQLSSTLRKDLQLNSSNISHGSQQFLRRATGSATTTTPNSTTTNHNTSVTRRFSSASTVGLRIARNQEQNGHELANSVNSGVNSDSDSGKHLIFHNKRVFFNTTNFALTNNEITNAPAAPYLQHRLAYSNSNTQAILPILKANNNTYFTKFDDKNSDLISYSLSGISEVNEQNENHDEIYTSPRTMNDKTHSCCTSMEEGSDNLLVTFDYGYSDSFDSYDANNRDFDMSSNKFINEKLGNKYFPFHQEITDNKSFLINNSLNETFDSKLSEDLWYYTTPRPRTQESVENMATAFKVHHMEYDNILMNGESELSLNSTLPEYNVDDENSDDDGKENKGSYTETELKSHKNEQKSCTYETDAEEEFYDSIECS